MAEKAVYSEFDEKTQLILKSRKNSNLIVDLLVYLDNKNEDHIVKTISCLKRVFMKHLSKRLWHQAFENARQFTHVSDGDLDSAIGDGDSSLKFPPKDHVADDNNAEMVFAKWIHEKYLDFVRKLLDFLGTKETHVEKATLDSLMELLFADHKAIVSSKFQKLSYYFPNTLFYKIISHMLHGGNGQEDLIEYFANQYLSYDDIKFYCMKNIQSILATKTDKEDIFNKQIAFTFISNIYSFLKSISPPKEDNESLNLFVNTNINESTAQDILGSKEFSKKFSAAWLSFLRLHLPPIIQKKVLLNLHTKVMPFLDDPKLLVDFLTDSYNVKGATSLLALNGLFILIHQYNLDYPEFYKKLYNLFDASVFHSKYKDRFFHLSDLFLSSTHLPSYLVAAFIKRLARLSLTAPPDGIRIIITFIENLLKRHPSCKTLIHRKQVCLFYN